MQFFASAINTLQTLVIALGAGLGVWGVVNLLEGYGSDNPGAKPRREEPGYEAAHGWRRHHRARHHSDPPAVLPVLRV